MARRRVTKRSKVRDRPSARTLPMTARSVVAAPVDPASSNPATASDADEPQALVASFWIDSGDELGEPYSVSVRFHGLHAASHGTPRSDEMFTKDESVDGIVPGSGRLSITTWIYGIKAGEWTVTGEVIGDSRGRDRAARTARMTGTRQLARAVWSWRRWSVIDGPETPIPTRWALLAPIARQPAVVPGLYFVLAIFGIASALLIQAAILGSGSGSVSVGGALTASAIAIAAGLIGAKLWYAVLHPDESIIRGGWAVDGFLIVVPVAAAVTLFQFNLPIGAVLDASTPGIFAAVAIGRVGCFLTGCCAGRCTASRWGIWSSDRRLGARRVPTQLLESGAGLVIGLVTLSLVAGSVVPIPGVTFAAAFAAYAIVRQILLRLRVERRKSARTVSWTGLAAAVVVVVVLVLIAVQGA